MVARSITAETFGVYGNISDVLTYFTLASGIFPFWATRFVARNHAGSSVTVLLSNLIIAVPFALLYLLILPMALPLFQVSAEFIIVYLLISVQIIEIYLLSALEASLQAKKPQALGFGFMIFEISKVCIGYALIIWFGLGLIGAVIAVILATIIQLIFYFKIMLPKLRENVKWNYVKEWVKASPFTLYGLVGQRLADSILLLLFIYGGKLARGYYGAALTIAGIVGYSASIGYALYPSLLSKNQSEDITSSLKLVLMFAIPMAFGAVVMADSYLTILNLEYSVARPILTLLSIDMLALCFSSIFGAVVSGVEKLDAEAKIPWKKMIKSKLFLFLTLPYFQAAIALPLAYYVLNYVAITAVDSALFIASIVLTIDLGLVVVRYIIAKKSLRFQMPLNHIIKFIGAAAVMALLLYVLPHPTRLTVTVALTLIGGCVYFIILAIIDSESRAVIKDAIKELPKIIKPHESA
jgi:O-antigen/teichoic acid export membrane protein